MLRSATIRSEMSVLILILSILFYCRITKCFVQTQATYFRQQQKQPTYFRLHESKVACERDEALETGGNMQSIRPITADSRKGSLPSTAMVAVMMTILGTTVVHSAFAVDNPVDYFHLRIPNPIPDADPRYFLSGGLCAAASHGITTPIDVVKTKIQADPDQYKGCGTLEAATKIIQSDGISALAAGLGPTVLGYGLEGAAKFGLYESLKPEFARLLHMDSPAVPYLIASVIAGAVASLMLCPMEQTRIRLVTDPNFASNFLAGIPQIVQESGFGSLFSGLSAMLSKQVPYTFAKQVSFDTFAAVLYRFARSISLSAADVKLEVSFGAAFLASVLACILSQPGDVVLTATYKDANHDDETAKQFGTIVSNIYTNQGPPGFFAGISARFLHVGAIITSQLVLYDTIKQTLGLPATGS